MLNNEFIRDFENRLNCKLLLNEPLAKYTTVGVGGPADYLFQAYTEEEVQNAFVIASTFSIPVLFLGGGSNVVINDSGFRGLVIRCMLQNFTVIERNDSDASYEKILPRLHQLDTQGFYDAETLDSSYTVSTPVVSVKAGAGWKLNALIQHCLQEGLTGLEWFAGIPGSVGGAVYMNIHGGTHFFSEFVVGVEVFDMKGHKKYYSNRDIAFGYDDSRFHTSREVITSVVLQLYKGDVTKAQQIVRSWGLEKIKKQPQKSAGCMFQNLSKDEQDKTKLPTSSVGYVIDKVLGLSGKQIGGAVISPRHCAFIENTGNANAEDVKSLVELVEKAFEERFGFPLRREVEFI